MALTGQQQTMVTKRWATTTTPMDLGDVIGIDLGTTNSCVSVMVCYVIRLKRFID